MRIFSALVLGFALLFTITPTVQGYTRGGIDYGSSSSSKKSSSSSSIAWQQFRLESVFFSYPTDWDSPYTFKVNGEVGIFRSPVIPSKPKSAVYVTIEKSVKADMEAASLDEFFIKGMTLDVASTSIANDWFMPSYTPTGVEDAVLLKKSGRRFFYTGDRGGKFVRGETVMTSIANKVYSVTLLADPSEFEKDHLVFEDIIASLALKETTSSSSSGIRMSSSSSSSYTSRVVSFTDVNGNLNYYDAIAAFSSQGFIQGYPDGSFKPGNSINRAEFLKIVLFANGTEPSGQNCFKDVKDEWFAPWICAASERGIVGGYPDGFFRPEQSITFAEAAKMLAIAAGVTQPPTTPWYKGPVEFLSERRAIPPTIYGFGHVVNRSETAVMGWLLQEEDDMGKEEMHATSLNYSTVEARTASR